MLGKKTKIPLETEASWFLLACALDVVMTFVLLHMSATGQTSVRIVESNPLARWVIHHWGLSGMIVFKSAMSVLVVGIALAVYRVRPVVARLLLVGGTIVVTAVVVYSVRMLLLHR